jgi:hypothetical protein
MNDVFNNSDHNVPNDSKSIRPKQWRGRKTDMKKDVGKVVSTENG